LEEITSVMKVDEDSVDDVTLNQLLNLSRKWKETVVKLLAGYDV